MSETTKRSTIDFDPQLQRLALLEGLSRGERDLLHGRTYSQNEAKEKMGKWLK